MASNGETSPLLKDNDSNNYYFLSNEDKDVGEQLETLPEGSSADEFAPRVLGANTKPATVTQHDRQKSLDSKNFFSRLLGFSRQTDPIHEVNVPMKKPRKAPIKVEPKVFFANERTFLAWMHVSIILAGASIAILAFSDHADQNTAQIYGLITLPVAVIFIVYAMYQYTRRAFMIRNKHPGPYEDTVGPAVLGIVLMLSITAQFAIKLNSIR